MNKPAQDITATDIKPLIEAAFKKSAASAYTSEYDRDVCIKAVIASKNCINNVLVKDPWSDYLLSVITALENLQANYNDPDGEYTNGKAIIGTIIQEIYLLAQALCSPKPDQ